MDRIQNPQEQILPQIHHILGNAQGAWIRCHPRLLPGASFKDEWINREKWRNYEVVKLRQKVQDLEAVINGLRPLLDPNKEVPTPLTGDFEISKMSRYRLNKYRQKPALHRRTIFPPPITSTSEHIRPVTGSEFLPPLCSKHWSTSATQFIYFPLRLLR